MMNQPENTIPFSIEKWKAGYEAVCRDGMMPSELHYFGTAAKNECLVGICDKELLVWYEDGRYQFHAGDKCDLFLRPKMEKWYRRAYWAPNSELRILVEDAKNAPTFEDSEFTGTKYKWAGPIEEFEVMAREG